MEVRLFIPRPPSLNALWCSFVTRGKNGKLISKRVRSPAYNKWTKEAGWVVRQQMVGVKTIECRYNMELLVPISRRDTGNWEKAISDLLQTMRVVSNDGNVHQIIQTPVERDDVEVILTPLPDMGQVRKWAV